jgi:hypothetical protein
MHRAHPYLLHVARLMDIPQQLVPALAAGQQIRNLARQDRRASEWLYAVSNREGRKPSCTRVSDPPGKMRKVERWISPK